MTATIWRRVRPPRSRTCSDNLSTTPGTVSCRYVVVGLYDQLNFRFVKPTFYTFAGEVYQFVRHRRRRQTFRDFENFLGPLSQVAFAKRSSLHGHAHPVTHLVLPLVRFRFGWVDELGRRLRCRRSLRWVTFLWTYDECRCTNVVDPTTRPRTVSCSRT